MSLFSLFDPAVVLVHTGLTALASELQPVLGGAAVAVSLVLVTMIVRACLLPLAVSVLRAERARLRLAPELARLRKRHADDPNRLLREVRAAHQRGGISPLAGMLPALAQGPALFVIYRLCQLALIGGVPNAVLAANLFGVSLAAHLPGLVLTAGLLSTSSLVTVLLVLALLLVAQASSRQQVRRLRAASIGEVVPTNCWSLDCCRSARSRWPPWCRSRCPCTCSRPLPGCLPSGPCCHGYSAGLDLSISQVDPQSDLGLRALHAYTRDVASSCDRRPATEAEVVDSMLMSPSSTLATGSSRLRRSMTISTPSTGSARRWSLWSRKVHE